jgi:uncharacterized repeat protein (TIGR01451 family)
MVTPPPPLFADLMLSKQANRAVAEAGGVITYTLSYSNVGLVTAEQVVITETVPVHTALLLTQSTPGWTCPVGTEAGAPCTFALAQVEPQQQGVVLYVVQVENNLAVATQIRNAASIGDRLGESVATIANNVDALTLKIALPTALEAEVEPKRLIQLLFLPIIMQK